MKFNHNFILATGLTIALFACKENKTETSTATNIDTVAVPNVPVPAGSDAAAPPPPTNVEAKTVVITNDKLPASVKTSFEKKHPKATKVEWMTYEPIDYDGLNQPTYYYVTFNDGDILYYDWYNTNGDWVRTSTAYVGGSDKLPAAVNKTIADKYPGFTIKEVDKENDKDMDMYEVKLEKGDSKVKAKILPNGEIFKLKEKL